MKRNVGTTEKWVRIIVGIVILSLLIFIPSGWRWLGLIGLIPLITGIIGYCPMYALLGISTYKEE